MFSDPQPSTSGQHLKNPLNPFYNGSELRTSNSNGSTVNIMREAELETISNDIEFHDAASDFHEDLQESLDQRNFVSF